MAAVGLQRPVTAQGNEFGVAARGRLGRKQARRRVIARHRAPP